MATSRGASDAELLDDALRPTQVLQRIDHVICLFLSDLTACSLPLLELVRNCLYKQYNSLLPDHLGRHHWFYSSGTFTLARSVGLPMLLVRSSGR